MTPEARKQLEDKFGPLDPYYHEDIVNAAWDLAVKAERERIGVAIMKYPEFFPSSYLKDLLNPPAIKQTPAEEGEDE